MTLSLAGWCPRTGETGCAMTTSSTAGGARTLYVAPGHGAVLSQARSDPGAGQVGVRALQAGRDAQAAVDAMVAASPHAAWRQFAVVDGAGRVAHFTGLSTAAPKGACTGEGAVSVGNAVAGEGVMQAMVAGFLANPSLALAERLVMALEHGRDAGGEPSPLRSAALKVVRPGVPFAVVDLRVDLSATPVADLRRCWVDFAPMVDAYVLRAMDPAAAPDADDIERRDTR